MSIVKVLATIELDIEVSDDTELIDGEVEKALIELRNPWDYVVEYNWDVLE